MKHNQNPKGFTTSSNTPKINGNGVAPSPPMVPKGPQNSAPQNSVPQKLGPQNSGPQKVGPQKLGPQIPTKQYNSPKNMYSDEAIKEIMEQQTEVLAGGVRG